MSAVFAPTGAPASGSSAACASRSGSADASTTPSTWIASRRSSRARFSAVYWMASPAPMWTMSCPDEPIVNLRGEKVALGPLRRELIPDYNRWINEFEGVLTLCGQLDPVTLDQ